MMYRIAGLNVSISGGRALLTERAEAYRTEITDTADFIIEVPQGLIHDMHFYHPHLTEDECAYIFSGDKFSYNLIEYGGFKLHASAVVLDGWAYLFSATSGIGKSTHTALWCEYFGQERAYILNDDAPALKPEGDIIMAWGNPWSGSSPLNRNKGVPVKAIAFLERAQSDWIHPMNYEESVICLLEQTRRSREPERLEKLMSMIERLLKSVPIYRLGCTISHNAVQTAYAVMNNRDGERSCTKRI